MTDRHALVVGIDAYAGGIPPLGSARKDAEAIAQTLATEHGYEVKLLLDAEATLAAVVDFLTKEIPAQLTVDTPFLVYFAGHGVAEGEDGSKGPQGYLILQDSKLGKPDSWLSMDVFRAALDALACRHLLVVLDCCYAGAFRWATATRDIGLIGSVTLYESVYQRYLDGEAWQALTSASADQRAADEAAGLPNLRTVNADGHSPFAAALIEGLAGAADTSTAEFPPDGVITATELYQYVATCLQPASDAPAVQTPGIWPLKPENIGEYVFLNPTVPLKVAPDPPLDDSNNPWLGLEAYTAASKDLYFGRQDETAELVARVTARRARHSLLAVVGASGAGKSSLVQAGLVPALDPSKWAVVQSARLAGDPNVTLTAALKELDAAPKRRRRLLVLDQFEELFTQCPDAADRARFLNALRELITTRGGPVVVLTLRSDFELRAADDEALKDLWQEARYQVPPFSGDDLRQVIMSPAQVKAVYYDPGTVADDLFDEVSQTPGALPLLSFALAELYRQGQVRRRKSGGADRALTTADYRAIGGVVGALNRRATQLYDCATPELQQAIRRVFLRLVSQEGAGLTGRRVERAELQFGDGDDAEQQCVDSVIQRYVKAGLLVIDGDSVEPAHDALVAQWQELHDWLKASDSQDLLRAAWNAACDWAHEHDKRKAKGYLWDDDPRLPQLAAASRAGELNAAERTFEVASTGLRTARRRRVISTTAAVIATLLAAMLIALLQRSDAIRQKRSATSQALTAFAHAQSPGSLDASLLLTLAAYRVSPTLQATNEMITLLESAPDEILHGSGQPVLSLAFAPRGQVVAAGAPDGTVRLWDVAAHRPLGQALQTGQGKIVDLVFDPVAGILATAGTDGVRLWRIEGSAQPKRIPLAGPAGAADSVAFNKAGTMLAVGYDNPGTVWIWHLSGQTPGRHVRIPQPSAKRGADEAVVGIAFSPNGKSLAAARADGSVSLLAPAEPNLLRTIQVCENCKLHAVAFGRGGTTLAVAGPEVMLLDLKRRASPVPLGGSAGNVYDVAFSPDGRSFAAALGSGKVLLWSVEYGVPRGKAETLDGRTSAAEAVAFSPSGHALVAGGAGGAVLLWHVPGRGNVRALGGSDPVGGVAFSPDGRLVATATQDDGAAVFGAGTPTPELQRSHIVSAVAFSPDGRRLAVGIGNGSAPVWLYAVQGDRVAPDPRSLNTGAQVLSLAFSPDGRTLAVGGNEITLWDIGTRGARPRRLPGSNIAGVALSLAFSPDGQTLAAGYNDGTVRLWNLTTGRALDPLTPPGHGAANVVVAFSPDGRTLAAGYDNGYVQLWTMGPRLRPIFTSEPELPARTLTAGGADSNIDTIAFSPDGRTLAAGHDTAVRLWDVRSQSTLGAPLVAQEGIPASLAFSPDGRDLVAGGDRGTVVWRGFLWADTADLISRVCDLVVGSLGIDDWKALAPGLPYEKSCPAAS